MIYFSLIYHFDEQNCIQWFHKIYVTCRAGKSYFKVVDSSDNIIDKTTATRLKF